MSNNNDLIEQITEITKAQKELQARILEEEKKKQKEDAEKKLAMLIEEEEIEKKLSKGTHVIDCDSDFGSDSTSAWIHECE